MRWTITLLIILLLATTASAQSIGGSDIEVSLLSQNPDPVEPGEIVIVKFKVENTGYETTEDVILELQPKFPFSLYGDEAKKNLGVLRAVSTGSDARVVEYKLKIDEKAVEKETELELLVRTQRGAKSYTNDEFLIDIQTRDAIIEITDVTLSPEQIPPGEVGLVTVGIKNRADSLLKDIRFKLDLDEVALAPYQSSAEQRLALLSASEQSTLTFKLIADPTATAGLYKIPLNITYNDERGETTTFEDILAISVGDTPNIKTYIKKRTLYSAKSAGKVTLEVANAGTTDIKFLELEILPSEEIELISATNYFYIGDVDADDTESEELDIYIPKKAQSVTLPVQLTYRDANSKRYQEQVELIIPLYSSSDLKKFGLVEGGSGFIYIVVLLAAGGGYYWYRRRKKKKE